MINAPTMLNKPIYPKLIRLLMVEKGSFEFTTSAKRFGKLNIKSPSVRAHSPTASGCATDVAPIEAAVRWYLQEYLRGGLSAAWPQAGVRRPNAATDAAKLLRGRKIRPRCYGPRKKD